MRAAVLNQVLVANGDEFIVLTVTGTAVQAVVQQPWKILPMGNAEDQCLIGVQAMLKSHGLVWLRWQG